MLQVQTISSHSRHFRDRSHSTLTARYCTLSFRKKEIDVCSTRDKPASVDGAVKQVVHLRRSLPHTPHTTNTHPYHMLCNERKRMLQM